ncbi:TIGR03617 family F420-dependent LLM class oxidoreductase [Jiangella asiatica]|uniref:TIGR03617 family F420-dependent LLM class oxidoreductase n=1 Tax=Jiangella asiatica TaxID=2530372 RepID=A0A4R5DLS2_9ACTN|nr:TIGR03617 family F420-dependent LLM class oxidoreductase [Jiangella asiatica]TDE11825.1 TIGR03617 family F420-dependent LLM class oxidoreductase [Jiangella asiatica]
MELDARLPPEALTPADVQDVARRAERLGLDALWSSENKHDAFLPLAYAAAATTRLRVGTSVAIAFSRSPMVVAQLAWDLQRMSGGRFLLGLGTQVKAHVTRRFAMPWGRPAARMRDYVTALRAIWRSFQDGTRLRHDGEFYAHTLLTPAFDPGPIDHPDIPVSIAGVNPGLTAVAGELCDGFHVHPFHSTAYLREVTMPNLARGAAAAGRGPSAVAVSASTFVVTGTDAAERDRARRAVRERLAFYASTPSYRTVLEVHGWESAGAALTQLARDGRWDDLPGLVTDEMLGQFAVEAAPDEVGATLRERYQGLLDRVAPHQPLDPRPSGDGWDRAWAALTRPVR